jgi:hypothetical protein
LRLLRESGLNTSQRAQGRSATGRTGEHQSDDRRADLSAQMQAIKIAAPDIIVAPGRIEKGGKFTKVKTIPRRVRKLSRSRKQ